MKSVSVKNISKSYSEIKAVDQISFDIESGELFGLIGPDGAGKSTLFRILTTLLLADTGTASVEGFDVIKDYQAIRNIVGYMPGRFSLYQDLTVKENLHFFATLFGTTLEENYLLIKDIYDQIKPFNNRRAGKLSGGMKQKLALCCALIHKPKVLFLDEPTTGVDVVSRKEFWEMLDQLKTQQITIIVSTPYMDEARLCDRIALMQNGKIMSIDRPGTIVENYPKKLFAVKSKNIYQLLTTCQSKAEVESCYAFGEFIHLTMQQDNSNEATVRAVVESQHFQDLQVQQITPSIEDSFIRLMRQQENIKVKKSVANGR